MEAGRERLSLFTQRSAQAVLGEAALATELADWRRRSDEDALWQRHNSQLLRLSATVDGLLAAARVMLDTAGDEAAGWRALLLFERALLAANRIWDHFRSKYLIRLHPQLGRMLRFADDFAWACYEPVQSACSPKTPKAPPLVYFSEAWSPFALARDRSFANELRFADSAAASILLDPVFEETLAKLPVPLVSLPWLQASHAPSMLIVAHEVGHIVSADFHLGAALEAQIAGETWSAGAACWQRWREEVFADIFGVLAGRDGFVGTLIGLLATDPARIASDVAVNSAYPPRSLRVEIALTALARLDARNAAKLRIRWETTYHDRPALDDPMRDRDLFIDLVFGLSCGGAPLQSLFGFKVGPYQAMMTLAADNNAILGQADFDAVAALILAQRIDEGRVPGFADKAKALEAICAFVDTRQTGQRAAGEAPPQRFIEADEALGALLWQRICDDGTENSEP